MEESEQVNPLFLSSSLLSNQNPPIFSAGQESQKIFKAKFPMDTETTSSKLSGFGFQLLENVDPNPENFVCAAIYHSRKVQVGCLLRLEPNKQAQVSNHLSTFNNAEIENISQMYRLTIRSSKDATSARLCELLQDEF